MTLTFEVGGIFELAGSRYGLNVGCDNITDQCYGLTITNNQTFTQFLTKHKGIFNYLILDDVVDGVPMIRLVRRAVNSDIAIDFVVKQSDCVLRQNAPAISYKRVDPMSLPRSIELQYISFDRGFAVNAQYARNEGARVQQAILSLQCDFILGDAQARALAYDLLFRMYSQTLTITFEHPDLTIEPIDIVQLETDQGTFIIQILTSLITKEPMATGGIGRTNQLTGQLLLTRTGVTVAAGQINPTPTSSFGIFHVYCTPDVLGVGAGSGSGSAPVVTGGSISIALPLSAGDNIGSPISATNSPTSWAITAGDPMGYFGILSNGQVFAMIDDIPPQAYSLTVQATNAFGSGSATETVTVTTSGTTYHVATTGSDSNSGTLGSPFLTFNHAASVVGPGDAILFHAGTYAPTSFTTSNNGSSAHPIYLSPYGTDHVVLSGANVPSGWIVQIYGTYTRLVGFEVNGNSGGDGGIFLYGCVGSRAVKNTVHNCIGTGIWMGPTATAGGNMAIGNTVHDCCLNNYNHALGSAGGWGQGINSQSTGNSIRGNTVYNNWGEGCGAYQADGAIIEDNTIYDNYSVQIYNDTSKNSIIRRNMVYSTGDLRWGYLGTRIPDGIRCAREVTGNQDTNVSVYDNIVVGTANGFSYMNYAIGGGMQNCLIANNAFVNNTNACIDIETDAGHSGNLVKNNICYGANPQGQTTGFTFDYNDWYAAVAGSGRVGAHDITSNPLFTGTAGSFVASNYMVQISSLCKAAGLNLTASGVTTDFGRNARPGSGAYTIGAWQ